MEVRQFPTSSRQAANASHAVAAHLARELPRGPLLVLSNMVWFKHECQKPAQEDVSFREKQGVCGVWSMRESVPP